MQTFPPNLTAWQDGDANTSERKLVTVLFSDLSGYSALCERLDPEDVLYMMNLVFKEVVSIIVRYEGYIERIIGDEVLAVFGIPRTHEDDPVRGIRAAMDIHEAVARMTDRFKKRLEKPLAMHSGIATGLVVTGKTDPRTGQHGITGEPVNRASILTNLATSGEILVGTVHHVFHVGFFLLRKMQIQTRPMPSRKDRCLSCPQHGKDAGQDQAGPGLARTAHRA
jgi:class 3 adenylate cyclase